VNKIIKLLLIENSKYGAASDSTRKGQNFFCKNSPTPPTAARAAPRTSTPPCQVIAA